MLNTTASCVDISQSNHHAHRSRTHRGRLLGGADYEHSGMDSTAKSTETELRMWCAQLAVGVVSSLTLTLILTLTLVPARGEAVKE